MLAQLPEDVLACVAAYLGEKPESFHRACRATSRVAHDQQALVLWLLATWGSSAVFMLTSIKCVSKWQQQHVLRAVRKLLDKGCTLEDPAQAGCVLFYFESRGFSEVLDLLLRHIASVPNPITQAQLKTLRVSLLKAACSKGHEGCVRVLLEQGADPNTDNGRPLKAAAEAGSAGVVRALLAAGADLHAGGECALRVCAAAGSPGHVEVMRVLLQGGADVHAKHDEALSLAVERSNVDAVALLLAHGASAAARQVLEAAATTGCARVVRLLLAHGADADADGGRPLRAAAGAGAVEVVSCLLDAGARLGLGRKSLGARPPPQLSSSFDETPGAVLSMAGAPARKHQTLASGSISRNSSGQELSAAAAGGEDGGRGSGKRGGSSGCVPVVAGVGMDTLGDMDDTILGWGEDLDVLNTSWEEEDGVDGLGEDDEEESEEEEGGVSALCTALCAGEGEVARVLLERGARVSPAVIRCWRQWHRYPGITALLARHPPTVLPQPAARHTLVSMGPASSGGITPSHSNALLASQYQYPYAAGPSSSFTPGSAPPTGGSACAHMAAWRAQSSMARNSLDGRVGVHNCLGVATPALTLALRTELVASAAEGSEAAVRLLLQWAAPQAIPSPAAAVAAAVSSAAALRMDDACMRTQAYGSGPGSSGSSSGPVSPRSSAPESPSRVLGALDTASLSTALVEAVAANQPVVVQQLLAHCPSPLWRAAALRPSAVLTAVSEGHIEITQVLLAAGAGASVLRVQPRGQGTSPSGAGSIVGAGGNKTSQLGLPPLAPGSQVSGAGRSVDAADWEEESSPPPPPLQHEAWGTAVLCAAAACKRGPPGTAPALVELLLQHGFGVCARDALRLAACGRVAPWKEEVAARILGAALSGVRV